MKPAIFASALFASLALAAPLNKRAYATKTHTVVETVMVYTTVWDGQEATDAPAATSSPALFFEKPSSAVAVTSSEAAPVVPTSTPEPVVETPTPEPSSEVPSSSAAPVVSETPEPTPTPEPVVPSPTPEPSSAPASSPEPSPEPTPEPSPEPSPSPEPTPSAPAEAASTQSSSGGSGSGKSYAGSLTMNYYAGGTGACGDEIADDEMVAALAVTGFGDSITDVMTGKNINPWCNQKITVTYNGKTARATIKDRCSGCTGEGGLDATPALWEALTGGQGGASGDRLDTGMSFTLGW